MTFPERFPFDVLDPDPNFCPVCNCDLREGAAGEDCKIPECTCHWELGPNGLRYRWGDK